MNERLKEYRDLVHITVKDITWIGTEISDDEQFPHVNIKIAFGSEFILIPISIKDIEANLHNAKGFVELITKPLEKVLKL